MSPMEITKVACDNPCHVRPALKILRPKKPQTLNVVKACKQAGDRGGRRDYNGRLVDESMMVLRRRIREMRILETSHLELPRHWMEWERQYFVGNYHKDVCEVIGHLQNFLVDVRPGLALGLVALLTLCVSITTGVVLLGATRIAKEIVSSSNWLKY